MKIPITEEAIDAFLKFMKDRKKKKQNPNVQTKAIVGYSSKVDLAKFHPDRCECNYTIRGVKACFGLTEKGEDSDGEPIVLHVLPQQSIAGAAAVNASAVDYVSARPELWHITGLSITKQHIKSLQKIQKVSIAASQIDPAMMDAAKLSGFTDEVVDFLVQREFHVHLDLNDKNDLFEVLKKSTFGKFAIVNLKGNYGLWGSSGRPIRDYFNFETAKQRALQRIKELSQSSPESQPPNEQDSSLNHRNNDTLEASLSSSSPSEREAPCMLEEEEEDTFQAQDSQPNDMTEFEDTLKRLIAVRPPVRDTAIVPLSNAANTGQFQTVMQTIRAARLGQAELLDLGRDIFIRPGCQKAFFNRLLSAGITTEAIVWTSQTICDMLTQEAQGALSEDVTRLQKIKKEIDDSTEGSDTLEKAIQAANLFTDIINNTTVKWNCHKWGVASLLICRADCFLMMETCQSSIAAINDCYQAEKLCAAVVPPSAIRFALEVRAGVNPMEYDLFMCRGRALVYNGKYDEAKKSFESAHGVAKNAIQVARDNLIECNLSNLSDAACKKQALTVKAKESLAKISLKDDQRNQSVPSKSDLNTVMTALLTAKTSPKLHLRKLEIMGRRGEWKSVLDTLNALATKNMRLHSLLHKVSNSDRNPFPTNPNLPGQTVLYLRPFHVYGQWYIRALRLQNRLTDADESLNCLTSVASSTDFPEVGCKKELLWLEDQRIMVDKCLDAVKETSTNFDEEVQKLTDCLNVMEPQYNRGPLHSFIYCRLGDLYAGVSRNSRENYELALEHFGRSLDIEKSFAAYAGRGICHRNHSLPNNEQALNDFNSALELDPSHMGVLLMRADLKLDLANPDYDGATADYEQWLRLAQTTYTSDSDKKIVEDKLSYVGNLRVRVRSTPRRHRRSLSAGTPSPQSLAAMNLYQRLGVDPQCSMQDLKAALRSKLLKHHTDHGGAPGAVQCILACMKLKDPAERVRYNHSHNIGHWRAD